MEKRASQLGFLLSLTWIPALSWHQATPRTGGLVPAASHDRITPPVNHHAVWLLQCLVMVNMNTGCTDVHVPKLAPFWIWIGGCVLLAYHHLGISTGLRCFSKGSFHHRTITSVEVNTPCTQQSLCMVFPSLHSDQVARLSLGPPKDLFHNLSKLLPCLSFCCSSSFLYISTEFGEPSMSITQKSSFFTMTASFTSGVHQRFLAFQTQLLTVSLYVMNLNIVCSNSMSLTSLSTQKNSFWRWELKLSLSLVSANIWLAASSKTTHHQVPSSSNHVFSNKLTAQMPKNISLLWFRSGRPYLPITPT